MKNLFKIIAITFIGVIAMTCNQNGPKNAKKTIITGHIKNLQVFPDDRTIIVQFSDFSGSHVQYTGAIDKNGNFKISFDQYVAEDVKLTQNFRISPIVEALLTHPGDSIHVDLDYKSITEVKFTGDAAETNTDLFEYTTGRYANAITPYTNFPLPNPVSFKDDCDKMKKELVKARIDFIDSQRPNDEVKTWTKNYINLRYYVALGNYLEKYRRSSAQPSAPMLINDNMSINHKAEVPLLKDYANLSEGLGDIYNTKVLNADSYNLLYYLMPRLNSDDMIKPHGEIMRDKIEQIAKENSNPLLKQLLIGDVFHSTLANNNPQDFDKNRSLLDTYVKASFIKQPLLKHYTTVKNNLADPKVTPNATLHNNNATSLPKTIMDTLIAQNKGKVVYVDFWATWCQPCKDAMPYTERLKEYYKQKNINFVAVCLLSPKDDWKSLVSTLKLTGNQYYCDHAESQSLISGLRIRAYPHYVMITKTGEIIANNLRPNDPLTISTIDKLLN